MKRYAFIPASPAPLEQRITPSHTGLASVAAIAPAVTNSHSLKLYGLALGSDTTAGTVHRLHATGGTLSPLGKDSLTGFLVIPNGRAATRAVHGTVTISGAQGTVRVSLTGTVTVYKGPFPFASGTLRYKIVSGTKADRGATGTGPVLYGPGPVFRPGRFLLDFGNYPPPP